MNIYLSLSRDKNDGRHFKALKVCAQSTRRYCTVNFQMTLKTVTLRMPSKRPLYAGRRRAFLG